MARQITQCPVCDQDLRVTELSCSACSTKLQGHFPPSALARLSAENQRFIETFVRCRGIIRDVERALGISYPTVRARLDTAVAALEIVLLEEEKSFGSFESENRSDQLDRKRKDLLRRVEEGSIDPEAAAEALRSLK